MYSSFPYYTVTRKSYKLLMHTRLESFPINISRILAQVLFCTICFHLNLSKPNIEKVCFTDSYTTVKNEVNKSMTSLSVKTLLISCINKISICLGINIGWKQNASVPG